MIIHITHNRQNENHLKQKAAKMGWKQVANRTDQLL